MRNNQTVRRNSVEGEFDDGDTSLLEQAEIVGDVLGVDIDTVVLSSLEPEQIEEALAAYIEANEMENSETNVVIGMTDNDDEYEHEDFDLENHPFDDYTLGEVLEEIPQDVSREEINEIMIEQGRNGIIRRKRSRRNAAVRSPVQPVLVHGYDRESPFGYEHDVNDYFRALPNDARPPVSRITATKRTSEQRENRKFFWDKQKRAGKPLPKSVRNGAGNSVRIELDKIIEVVKRNGALSKTQINRACVLSEALNMRNGALQNKVDAACNFFNREQKRNGAKSGRRKQTSKRGRR